MRIRRWGTGRRSRVKIHVVFSALIRLLMASQPPSKSEAPVSLGMIGQEITTRGLTIKSVLDGAVMSSEP